MCGDGGSRSEVPRQLSSHNLERAELCDTKELKGSREGDENEDGPTEEGVTFDIWKRTETPPTTQRVADEVCLRECHSYHTVKYTRNSAELATWYTPSDIRTPCDAVLVNVNQGVSPKLSLRHTQLGKQGQ